MLDMSKYKFYTTKNKVIAVSTYAGKIVRGIAKCNPEDEFDLEKGKELAAARCNVRVAKRRKNVAGLKKRLAETLVEEANVRLNKMTNYLNDSTQAYEDACNTLKDIINNI